MGAEVPVYVKVTKEVEQWIEVQAVTLTEAKRLAWDDCDVTRVISAQYDEPEGL